MPNNIIVNKINMLKQSLTLLVILMTCMQTQADSNEYIKTVEGYQFEAIGYNEQGIHHYRCVKCSEFVYGSGMQNKTHPDLEVLELHALVHENKAKERLTFTHIYLALKDSKRFRCQRCGEGVREALLSGHHCIR